MSKVFRRDSPEYRERQLAWQLMSTPEWKELLLPMLKIKLECQARPTLGSLNDCFQVNKLHAEINYTRDLLHRLERLAKEFLTLEVDPTS